MRLFRATSISLVALVLVACAHTPAVQLAANSKSEFAGAVYSGQTVELDKPTPGVELYRAFQQGATGFVSVASVRGGVEEIANQHCARRGRSARPIQETASTPPHMLGNYPRVEWLFECTDAPKAVGQQVTTSDKLDKLERLKKLLDNGTLTRQEFEAEKAKVLTSP
jgi:hypothetical protein